MIYVDSRTKVLVGCPLHGEFSVTPANHLFGTGCAKCARENRPDFIDARIKNDLEFAKRPGFIYVLNVLHRVTGRKFFKVGVTSMVTPAARFNYTRYEGFELSVRRAEAGTMRRVWETERLVKKLIKEHGFSVRRFAGDYWHWTESFEGESAIQAVEDLMDVLRMTD